MPANLANLPHLGVSSATNLPKSAGELANTPCPKRRGRFEIGVGEDRIALNDDELIDDVSGSVPGRTDALPQPCLVARHVIAQRWNVRRRRRAGRGRPRQRCRSGLHAAKSRGIWPRRSGTTSERFGNGVFASALRKPYTVSNAAPTPVRMVLANFGIWTARPRPAPWSRQKLAIDMPRKSRLAPVYAPPAPRSCASTRLVHRPALN
jgi:hypothetical protein